MTFCQIEGILRPSADDAARQQRGCSMGLLKIVGFVFFVSLMLGFGTCGICGVAMGASSGADGWWIVMLGLCGIALSVACFFIVRAIGRSKPKQ
jgi:hypothetical protein